MNNFCTKYRIWMLAASLGLLLGFVSARTGPGDPVIETGPYPLKYPENFGGRVYLPDDNPLTKEGVFLGRMLFYETRLSSDNTISCASCHRQEFAFADNKAFSHGVNDRLTDRNSMSIANMLWVRDFFWDGRARGLEAQAVFPITNPKEMNQSLDECARKLTATKLYPQIFKIVYGNDSVTGDRIVKALAQFERTLISANSKYDRYLRGEYMPTPDELDGMQLFFNNPVPGKGIRGAGCARCHGTVKTFIELYHNNGLDALPKDAGRQLVTGDPMDRGRFRVPTLRNIALTAPYMHDGRFKALNEVVSHYNEHLVRNDLLSPILQETSNMAGGSNLALTLKEQNNLVCFLNMLTDISFVGDKRFSNPHPVQLNK